MAKTPPRAPYHHGNLRSALIAAARDLIEKKGPDAVTLKELAEVAGVSVAAPYRHFADRSKVLAAVAAEGLGEVIEMNRRAFTGPGTLMQRLRLSAEMFLNFSREVPGLFRLMYSPPLGTLVVDPDLVAMTDVLNQELTAFLGQCCPDLDEDSLHILLLTIWALLFGHAMSTLSHPMQPEITMSLPRERVQEAVIDAMLRMVASAKRRRD